MNPELLHLPALRWQAFCTLTYAKVPSDEVGTTMFFSWVRSIAKWTKTDFRKVAWVLRREVGEVGGRQHLHALIGGLEREMDFTACKIFEDRWSRLRSAGHALVREFDGSCPGGVAYVLKNLGYVDGKNAYEMTKFGTASELMLAERTRKLIACNRSIAEKKVRSWRSTSGGIDPAMNNGLCVPIGAQTVDSHTDSRVDDSGLIAPGR